MWFHPRAAGTQSTGRAAGDVCPPWCALHRGAREVHVGGDVVHLSGPLVVRGTELRLACSADPATGAADGPHVLLGGEEFTLHEAEVLIDALTHLVDEGSGRTRFTDQGHRRRAAGSEVGGGLDR